MTISPKDGPISPLRRRMLEDMKMLGLREITQDKAMQRGGRSR